MLPSAPRKTRSSPWDFLDSDCCGPIPGWGRTWTFAGVGRRGDDHKQTGAKRGAMRYRAHITACSLKVAESRVIADLLLRGTDGRDWDTALRDQNVLQARSTETARRLGRLIRARLTLMGADLWRLVRDGSGDTATHAVLAAAVKHTLVLGDFLDLVVREQYRIFATTLSDKLWGQYLDDCRGRAPEMPEWNESSRKRLRSSVFQILAQSGYIDSTGKRGHPALHAPGKRGHPALHARGKAETGTPSF